MKELARLALGIRPSSTLAIDAMAKQMRADGIDVVGFGAGEPDFPTPDHIKEAAIQAIHNNETKYTPVPGTIELRKAICRRLKEDCGLDYDYTEIVASNGAKTCLYAAMRTLLNPGDEVILQAPNWVSYFEIIRMIGAVPVVVETTEEEGFKITPEKLSAAITDKTKCIILNNPSNPTGMVYSREDLLPLAKICIEKDLYVITDEIYYTLVYDEREFVSFVSLMPELKERTLLINGVSKAYAMTGWRLGYVAAPAPLAKILGNCLSHCAGNPSSISQKAALEALSGPQDTVGIMRQAFEERRNNIVHRINQIEGCSCIMPEGAFYVMMNIKKLLGRELFGRVINSDEDFASLLLEKGKVAVVPGVGFNAPGYIRWSYATSMENINRGLDRLELFLQGKAF